MRRCASSAVEFKLTGSFGLGLILVSACSAARRDGQANLAVESGGNEIVAAGQDDQAPHALEQSIILDRAQELMKRIDSEESSHAQGWDGLYNLNGEAFGLSSTSGFAWLSADCLSTGPVNVGSIRAWNPTHVTLDLERDPALDTICVQDESVPSIASTLYFVRWGQLRLLVPESRMVSLCNVINSGDWTNIYFFYPIHVDDRASMGGVFELNEDVPQQRPDIPAPWNAYILDHRMTVAVLSTGESRRVRTSINGIDILGFKFTVDVGANAGLRPCMELYRGDREESFVVVDVRDTESTVEYRYPLMDSRPPRLPVPGDRLSTALDY